MLSPPLHRHVLHASVLHLLLEPPIDAALIEEDRVVPKPLSEALPVLLYDGQVMLARRVDVERGGPGTCRPCSTSPRTLRRAPL